MMYLQTILAALVVIPAVFAAPGSSTPKPTVPATNPNIFIGKELYANSIYAEKLEQTAKTFLKKWDFANAARVKTVQKTGTFGWISSFADLKNVPIYIKEAYNIQKRTGKKQLVELVVYNLPERDCSAKSSAGELFLNDGGAAKYKDFINKVKAALTTKEAKELSFALVLEPDSLGNLVTNMAVEKCAGAADAYKQGLAYAISTLQLPNAALYIDAAHGGWLGWDGNLPLSAELYAEVLSLTTGNATIRGFATNVSNYNAYKASTREAFTEWSNSWDEYHYVQSLTPHLIANNVPANFIVDVGRSGKLAVRSTWGNWCNIKNAGFGPLPTTNTELANVDALVWVKPGGESDGTSDPTAQRYDEMCGGPDAHIPAPEAGHWFDEYVVNLVKNANPVLPISLW
ncbi:cellobiohydrolase [Peziza echinospora]|nr:cellobiohydrolase [Peziza echinospora]